MGARSLPGRREKILLGVNKATLLPQEEEKQQLNLWVLHGIICTRMHLICYAGMFPINHASPDLYFSVFLPHHKRDSWLKTTKTPCGEAFFPFFRVPLSFAPSRALTSFLLFFGAPAYLFPDPLGLFWPWVSWTLLIVGFFPSIYFCLFKWFTFIYLLEWWIFLTLYYLVLFLHSLKPTSPLTCGC